MGDINAIKEKILANVKTIEFLVIFAMIISMCVIYYIPTSMRVMPVGPLIGGDAYAHIGTVLSIRENWTPWIDQYYDGGIARAYSWFWHLVMAVISLAIPFWPLMMWSPIVWWILSIIGLYFIGKMMYGRRTGLFFAMFFFLIVDHALINPNPKNILVILFFGSVAVLYKAFEDKSVKWAVIAGTVVAFTLMTYSMLVVLLGVPAMYVLLTLLIGKYHKKESDKKKLDWKAFWHDVKIGLIVMAVGIVVSIPYWLPIVSSFDMDAARTQSISSSVEQHEGSPFGTRIYEITFNWWVQKWWYIPFLILGILAIFSKFDKRSRIIVSFMLVFYVGTFHDYITRPLFGWEGIQPFYFPVFVNIMYWLVVVLGFVTLFNKLTALLHKAFKQVELEKIVKIGIIVMLLMVIALGGRATYSYLSIGPESWRNFVMASYQPLPAMFTGPAEWVKQNTNDSDVIIAHPYYAYGIFGLTGRHIYAAMYGHMFSLMDDNDKRKDAQEIFTTSNMTRTLELLKKGRATYLIVDPYAADKSHWFEVDKWEVITGKKPMPSDERNVTKFINDPHFISVYNHTEVYNGQLMLVAAIYKIRYD